ncbi:MAG: hypothetical protein H6667_02435 [Ardenticatenaceae bacterium]|nr:hypothetical protein [Ardenticatenaceae bacterium]MCB9443368.1 hypothetical protein [Ardenticatenaceae bacterium]
MRQRDIFLFWLPLFASWLLMTAEGPTITAVINRLPNEVVMLAAAGIVISLSVTIESPIINMLATSTALVKDRQSYLLMRRFTLHWMVLLTAVSLLIAFTPLFDVVVTGWLEAPPDIAVWVRPGLQIMSLWSAAIGWRRFLQGILIRFDQTRKIAWGTMVRLVSSASTVIGLSLLTDWPGIINGAAAWMAGVLAEAIYATWVVRPLLLNELGPDSLPDGEPLTYRELFWFHLPLAGTSLLSLLAQPLVTSSLARLSEPTHSLAAWPVLFQITLMTRAAAFSLPEVVIALSKKPDMFRPIRQFSLRMAGGLLVIMALIVFTPLVGFYFFVVQDMEPVVGDLAMAAVRLFLFLPALAAITSWLRGLLINNKATRAINLGMAINLVVTAVLLAAGVIAKLPGLPTAAIALNLASVAENIYLGWRAKLAVKPGFSLLGPVPVSSQS